MDILPSECSKPLRRDYSRLNYKTEKMKMETIQAYMAQLNIHMEKIINSQKPYTDIDVIRDGLVEILVSLGYAPDDV